MGSVWLLSYWEVSWRLFLAAMLGGLIGWEREKNLRPAGLRTHILVCVGSALVMLISIYGFAPFMKEPVVTFDPSRISAQVISGIGFLGAGTIIRQGFSITGLTTAASLWVVAAIGLSVGAGYVFAAIFTTLLVFICLGLLTRWEDRLIKKKTKRTVRLVFREPPEELDQISSLLQKYKVELGSFTLEKENDHYTVTIIVKGYEIPTKLYSELLRLKGMEKILNG